MSNRILIIVAVAGLLGLGAYAAASKTDTAPPAPSEAPAKPTKGKPAATGEISWLTDFDAATKNAEPGQVIFVDVYTEWCTWCKYMDQKVYTSPSVKEFAAENVFVKLDAEDGGIGQAFAQKNSISGYPTLLVYSADGKLLKKQPGAFRQPDQFLGWLKSAKS